MGNTFYGRLPTRFFLSVLFPTFPFHFFLPFSAFPFSSLLLSIWAWHSLWLLGILSLHPQRSARQQTYCILIFCRGWSAGVKVCLLVSVQLVETVIDDFSDTDKWVVIWLHLQQQQVLLLLLLVENFKMKFYQLLHVPLQNFIQLSLTLTKYCHSKCNHPLNLPFP